MKVRIAAETLSNSVANAMQFLMSDGHKEFIESSATIKYVRFINDLFDIMNTKRTGKENRFKNPINEENKLEVFAFFRKLCDYLPRISFTNGELAGKYVINTKNKTAFKGLVINMFAFRSIYEEYVETNLLDCLPTFKFSQDHLESFFGRIRSGPGNNDNPTVFEFNSLFKKIIVCNEIACSEKANCEDNINLTIMEVSARPIYVPSIPITEDFDDDSYVERLIKIRKNLKSNDMLKISIAYIAGTIENKIISSARFECGDCFDLFFVNDQYSGSFTSNNDRVPRQSTFDICEIAH